MRGLLKPVGNAEKFTYWRRRAVAMVVVATVALVALLAPKYLQLRQPAVEGPRTGGRPGPSTMADFTEPGPSAAMPLLCTAGAVTIQIIATGGKDAARRVTVELQNVSLVACTVILEDAGVLAVDKNNNGTWLSLICGTSAERSVQIAASAVLRRPVSWSRGALDMSCSEDVPKPVGALRLYAVVNGTVSAPVTMS